jgi:SlyX protein
MSPAGDGARFEILEIKLAHVEHALNELSDVLARQQRELDDTRRRLWTLAERLAGFEAAGAAPAALDEKPPHY